ncbi:MAG: glycosyltransferase [Candidatus Altiarchaeales archaeon]|nr:glycosyltransferase [Candidatus Altiarchaeales archaeon]MBD3416536.1 glycosyltransferase [Candidatus Altiarchaeales archaeon]
MKVALVSEYFPMSPGREMRGGVEARTYFVSRHLAKRHDVKVYSIMEDGMSEESEFEGMRVARVKPEVSYSQSSSLDKRLMFMRNAAKEIRKGGYDLVDGCSVTGYPPAWWSKCRGRVITYHDLWTGRWIQNMGWKGLFGEVLERYVLSRNWDHITAVSQYTKDNLVDYGIDADRITVAHNGIDLEEYKSVNSEKYDSPTVCAVARMVKYKRLEDLIRAHSLVREEVEDARVRIIGTGPERERLESLSESLGVSDSVEFIGYVREHAEVLKTIKSSHCLCLPSAVEGFGITVVEAMALDVPYVASDIPAVREATRGGAGGSLYKLGDVEELAEKLKAALNGEVRGGVKFIEEYDWSRTAEKVEDVYERVVERS